MITTGAKFYFGLGFLLVVAAVLYGWTSGGVDWSLFPGNLGTLYFSMLGALTLGFKGAVGDHVGYVILLGAAASSVTVGGFLVAFRDADAEAIAEVAGTPEAPPLRPVGSNNYWAPVGAFGVAVAAIGVATSGWFVVAGVALIAFVALEWAMTAWADRSTGDLAVNAALRNKIMNPIEVPAIGVLVAAFVALGISRAFLALDRIAAVWVFMGVATLIFVAAIGVSLIPRPSRNLLTGLVVLGMIGVLAAGISGVVVGGREFHDETEEFTEPGQGGIGPRRFGTTTTEAGGEGVEAPVRPHDGE
jgi:hypothetical protein